MYVLMMMRTSHLAYIVTLWVLLIVAAEQKFQPLQVLATEEGSEVNVSGHFHSQSFKAVNSINESSNHTNTSCPPWFVRDSDGNCTCGDKLGGIINCDCDGKSNRICILNCYCMTQDKTSNTTVVGACEYGCFKETLYSPLTSNASELDQLMCGLQRRTGQLCGQCISHFAPPVPFYHLKCVNCTEYDRNWVKFVAMSLLPPTIFLMAVIIFRFSANSPKLKAFVFISQVIAAPPIMRAVVAQPESYFREWERLATYILFLMYAIWNLDFFSLFYEPFCLHPNMITLQVLALDYIVALYPLLLVVVTYMLVEAHDRNFRPIVWLWKPFHRKLARFRRWWNIRTSLVDAFATFLSLSWIRLGSVSFDLLLPTWLHDATGKRWPKLYMYYDGTVEFFGPDHLFYGIIAISVFFLFIIIPVVVLCLYPCRCCRRCLNICRLDFLVLKIFMDAFQGHYKDGTNGTQDCRYFASVYLIVRVALAFCIAVTQNEYFFTLAVAIFIGTAMAVAVIQPYKSPVYNALDAALILILAWTFLFMGIGVGGDEQSLMYQKTLSILLAIVSGLIPLVYITTVLLHWLFVQQKVAQKVMRMIHSLVVWAHRRGIHELEVVDPQGRTLDESTSLLSEPVA